MPRGHGDRGDLSAAPLPNRTVGSLDFFSLALNSVVTSLQHGTNTLLRTYQQVALQHRRKSMVFASILGKCRRVSAIFLAGLMSAAIPALSQSPRSEASEHQDTATPIKHVIILIGENRTFDNIFATYRPKHGKVANLLSEGIINE